MDSKFNTCARPGERPSKWAALSQLPESCHLDSTRGRLRSTPGEDEERPSTKKDRCHSHVSTNWSRKTGNYPRPHAAPAETWFHRAPNKLPIARASSIVWPPTIAFWQHGLRPSSLELRFLVITLVEKTTCACNCAAKLCANCCTEH